MCTCLVIVGLIIRVGLVFGLVFESNTSRWEVWCSIVAVSMGRSTCSQRPEDVAGNGEPREQISSVLL